MSEKDPFKCFPYDVFVHVNGDVELKKLHPAEKPSNTHKSYLERLSFNAKESYDKAVVGQSVYIKTDQISRDGINNPNSVEMKDCEVIKQAHSHDTTSAEGKKLDQSKLRYDLLCPAAQAGLVKVLTLGAEKYTDRNWEAGILYSRVFAAAMRHLWAWWGGQDNDPETGESHLDHAAANIHFLSAYIRRPAIASKFDNRPNIAEGLSNKIAEQSLATVPGDRYNDQG